MLDICLLGTGGMMPLPYRFLTSLAVRYEGSTVLIDCGEGTQVSARKNGVTVKPVDVICFTHYHADHISGLPGLLLSMGNSERTEPVLFVGPKGLERVVNALRVIAPELPFKLQFHELKENEETIANKGMVIRAFRVNHNVICYGYNIEVPRAGKFNVENAKALGLPVTYWNPLQKGRSVEWEGKTYTPDMVMGEARRGLKVTYCTDTRPVPAIAAAAKDADLFICEGMYGDPAEQEKAVVKKHMTFAEAGKLAAEAQPGEFWLTHFSPSMNHPEEFIDEARAFFPEAKTGRDGKKRTLRFDDADREG